MKKNIHVVAAIIESDDKILCVQRGENKLPYISKKYEFPGGKIEEGESPEETIVREIKEELHMDIVPVKQSLTVHHEYPDFILHMDSFICSCVSTELTLTEHIDYRWLSINELPYLDWAAADVPIVEELMREHGGK